MTSLVAGLLYVAVAELHTQWFAGCYDGPGFVHTEALQQLYWEAVS